MVQIDKTELVSGLLVIAIGGYFAYGALEYRMGTATRMGPGFVPFALGIITLGIGLLIVIGAFGRSARLPELDWRGGAVVLFSIAIFALLVRRAGLIPAALVSVLVSSFALPHVRILSALILAVGIALGGWIIFVLLLGITVPVIRSPF